jgi:predicted MFS family arabinose efflux permease
MIGILRSFRKRSSISDDEYIEGIRRKLSIYDRERRWWITFHAIILASMIGAAVYAGIMIQRIMGFGAANAANGLFGLGVGMAIGASLGGLTIHSIQGLITVILPMRSEHLLIKYHDAIQILLAERRPEEERSAVR